MSHLVKPHVLMVKWFMLVLHRLKMLHEVLSEMAASPRVVQCAQVVPVLLHVFFNNVTKVNSTGQWHC